MLRVSFHESAIQHLTLVGLAVAVGVFGVKHVRRTRDEDTTPPRRHAVGISKIVKKNRRLVVTAVVIGVLEKQYAAPFASLAVDATWIISHLRYPQLPIRPKGNRHWVKHQRLMHRQVDFKARPHAHGRERHLWRFRPRE